MLEKDLATTRYKDCEKQAELIKDASIPIPAVPTILIRDAMKMTCQRGAGQKEAAQVTETAILPESAQLHKVKWVFAPTRHYLATSPAFEASRASWIALYQSLEDGDGTVMAAALHQLEEVMKQCDMLCGKQARSRGVAHASPLQNHFHD